MTKPERRPAGIDISPDLAAFAKPYAGGRAQVLATRLVADLETPVSAYLKLAAGRTPAFLLESVEGGTARGRYSIIGLCPDIIWRATGSNAEISRTPAKDPDAFVTDTRPTLTSLRAPSR